MLKLFAVELFFVLFILYIERGLSLNCYQCRSDEENECSNSSVNISFSKACENGTACRKIKQKLRFKEEKTWTIIRECAANSRNACYHFKWLQLAYQEVCECDTDNCNFGSIYIMPDFFTIGVVLSLIWIFNYLKANNT